MTPELITRIIDEAKQILAEVGIEVRGPALRERLLAHGLPTDPSGKRICFPPAVVDRALASAPRCFAALPTRASSRSTKKSCLPSRRWCAT